MDSKIIREIQLKQLSVLKQLISVFENEGINYFVIGGTALGAVRHNGFIPWDDDIDIGMLREDYDKFLSLQNKLPEHLKIYNFTLFRSFPLFFSKVYDMNTPYYCHSNRKYDVPKKIFIDIFPWNNISNTEKLRITLERINKKFKRLIFKSNGSLIDKAKFFMYKILYGLRTSTDLYNEYQDTIQSSISNKSDIWGDVLFNDVLQYKDIFPLKKMKFEDIEVNIPNNFEHYLSQKYGDYMTPPPENERINHSRGKFEGIL